MRENKICLSHLCFLCPFQKLYRRCGWEVSLRFRRKCHLFANFLPGIFAMLVIRQLPTKPDTIDIYLWNKSREVAEFLDLDTGVENWAAESRYKNNISPPLWSRALTLNLEVLSSNHGQGENFLTELFHSWIDMDVK
jgi:hypothetical protein